MLRQMSQARDLAARAYEMGALVLRGQLVRQASGDWTVDGQSVAEWLAELAGQQVYLIAIGAGAGLAPTASKHNCHTCGREYEGHECPYCREARLRLRGE
jgi:hypothetical protein